MLLLRFLTISTSAATLVGCASYRPEPLLACTELERLRNQDLRQFVVERALPGGRNTPANLPFNLADGLDETEVVAVALTLNPDLRAKRAEVGETDAALISAGMWPNPEVGVSPKWGLEGASGLSIDADALFHLLRPGERDARRQVAEAQADQIRADVFVDEFKLVDEVRTQRLDVFAAERSVAMHKEALALRDRVLDLVRGQRRLGEGTELDVSTTELEAVQVRRDLRRAEAGLATQRRNLNRLMGIPAEYPVPLTGLGDPLTITIYEDLDDDELDRRLLAGRPELQASEAAYLKAEQELRLAVIAQWPRLGIGPSFEKDLGGEKGLGAALSLELPLLNQNQGEIAERRAARERTRAQYVALLYRLTADASAARAEVRTAQQEVKVQEREILPLLSRNRQLFEGAFRARELNVIDWITAQQRAVDAQREYVESLIRYQKAVIRLETATGQSLSQATTRPTASPEPLKD